MSILTSVNFLVTMVGVMLVDRKGRKFLLSLGSAGIIASLVCVGFVFRQTEKTRVDCKDALAAMAQDYQDVNVTFDKSAGFFPRQRHYAYPGWECRYQGLGRREGGLTRARSRHRRGQDRQG